MIRKIVAAALLMISIGALSGCYWEHDRGWHGDVHRDPYWERREHDDRRY